MFPSAPQTNTPINFGALNMQPQGQPFNPTPQAAPQSQDTSNQLTPEIFKQRVMQAHPEYAKAIASDGTPYASMDATDFTQRFAQRYPNARTKDGHAYADFLPKQAPSPPPIPVGSAGQSLGTPDPSKNPMEAAKNITNATNMGGAADTFGSDIAAATNPQLHAEGYLPYPSLERNAGALLQTGAIAATPFIGPESVMGNIAAGAGLGAAQMGGQAMSEGASSKDVLQRGTLGALFGGTVSGLASGMSSLLGAAGNKSFSMAVRPTVADFKDGYDAQFAVDNNLTGTLPQIVSKTKAYMADQSAQLADKLAGSDSTIDLQSVLDQTKADLQSRGSLLENVGSNAGITRGLQKLEDEINLVSKPTEQEASQMASRLATSGGDWEPAIQAGDIPKEQIYTPQGTFTPDAANHVVSDLVGKLNMESQGLGDAFQSSVDMSNPTRENLVKQAADFYASQGKSLSIPDAQKVKQATGFMGEWVNGSADPDAAPTATVYNKFYSNLRQAIEDNSPEGVRGINANLQKAIPIIRAALRRVPVAERNGISLTDMLAVIGSPINPAGIALAAGQHLMSSGLGAKVLPPIAEGLSASAPALGTTAGILGNIGNSALQDSSPQEGATPFSLNSIKMIATGSENSGGILSNPSLGGQPNFNAYQTADNAKLTAMQQYPLTNSAKSLINNSDVVKFNPVLPRDGTQRVTGGTAEQPDKNGKVRVDIGFQEDPSVMEHELFNSLFVKSGISPDSFNEDWEKTKQTNPNNAGFNYMDSLDNVLNQTFGSTTPKSFGEDITKDAKQKAAERFSFLAQYLGKKGLSAIPPQLQGYYKNFLQDPSPSIANVSQKSKKQQN